MSLSGSSASRNKSCAMTRLASSSSMNVGRKMIRSLSRREKMSNARSPRGVCSTTIGTKAIGLSLRIPYLCVLDQEIERFLLAQATTQVLQVSTLLHHTANGRTRALRRLRELFDLGVDFFLAGRD